MNIKEAHAFLDNLLTAGIDPDTALIINHPTDNWCNHTEISTIKVGYHEYTEQVDAQAALRRPYSGLSVLLMSDDQIYKDDNIPLRAEHCISYRSDRPGSETVRGPGVKDPLCVPKR